MSVMLTLSPVDRLYVDSVHITPQERDWSTGYGDTWEYVEAPECPECGTYAQYLNGSDMADEMADRDEINAAPFSSEDWPAWRCPNVSCDGYGVELDPHEHGAEGPMMNYAYSLPSGLGGDTYDEADAAKIAHLPLCIVRHDGSALDGYELALTGGGMDLSWEICEAFMRLGHLPPLHFCDLPQFAGMEMDERRRWILAGCLRSCDVAKSQAERAAARLRDTYGV